MINYLIFTLIGFFSGSLMFSYWLPKLIYHTDILKKSDDNNPGMTNALKNTSVPFGLLCLCLDILKGAVPVYTATLLVNPADILFSFILIAPVLGHAFSPLLKFKGGKAIAVSFGVLLGFINQSMLLVALAITYIIFSTVFVIKPHEYRSVAAFFVTFIASFFTKNPVAIFGMLGIMLIVSYKHISAYRRTLPTQSKPSVQLFIKKI